MEKVHSIRSYIQPTIGASSLGLAISFEFLALDLAVFGIRASD